MSIDIIKCENGWLVIQKFPNRGESVHFVFQTLQELARWVIEDLEPPAVTKGCKNGPECKHGILKAHHCHSCHLEEMGTEEG